MTIEREPMEPAHARETFALWTGVLGGPILWFIQFVINYWLAPHASASRRTLPIHIVSFCFFVLSLGIVFLAARNIRRADLNHPDEVVPARIHFMGRLGFWIALLFALLIAAQAIPSFIIRPGSD
jgi:hypothetical protein